MAGPEIPSFHWVDYVVFLLMLLASCGIGVYYACTGGKQKTTGEYILGDRQMSLFVISLSIMVSNISAILILGVPGEVYTFGGQYWLTTLGSSLGAVLAAFIFVPLLYPLKLTSVHEYLLLRYKSKWPQYLASTFSTVGLTLYTGVVLYAPATAIEGVTGFPTWASIAISGGVSTIYTTIGGFKAVVWTDAFQAVIMFAGCIAIVIQGAIKTGGLTHAWELAKEDARLNVFNFDPDPRVRVTFWSCVFGAAFLWTEILGVSQPPVQRYSALRSQGMAMKSVLAVIPGHQILLACAVLSGIAVYGFYASHGCDPLAAGYISNPNQIIPYFVMEVMSYYGVPGLFMSCVCAASLSSASSSLNSNAATTWQDILKDFFPRGVSEIKAVVINKGLVVLFGCLSSLLAFAMMGFGGNVIQLINILGSCVGGPRFGMFLLACIFPWSNWMGSVVGGLAGFGVLVWINTGAYLAKKHMEFLPSRTANCTFYGKLNNMSTYSEYSTSNYDSMSTPQDFTDLTSIGVVDHQSGGVRDLYSLSFLWLVMLGTFTTVTIGLLVSFATGSMPRNRVDKRLILPLVNKLLCGKSKTFQDPDLKYLEEEQNCLLNKEAPMEMSNMTTNRENRVSALQLRLRLAEKQTMPASESYG